MQIFSFLSPRVSRGRKRGRSSLPPSLPIIVSYPRHFNPDVDRYCSIGRVSKRGDSSGSEEDDRGRLSTPVDVPHLLRSAGRRNIPVEEEGRRRRRSGVPWGPRIGFELETSGLSPPSSLRALATGIKGSIERIKILRGMRRKAARSVVPR